MPLPLCALRFPSNVLLPLPHLEGSFSPQQVMLAILSTPSLGRWPLTFPHGGHLDGFC
uniref:Uncharacterized protein n=1 Tax=Balaenoptera musculus TaxID=9771 RepID=A0A8C0CBR3_BALMU